MKGQCTLIHHNKWVTKEQARLDPESILTVSITVSYSTINSTINSTANCKTSSKFMRFNYSNEP